MQLASVTMTTNPKAAVLLAFARVMKPLVRIMLRNGVLAGEFIEVLRHLYVEAATDLYRQTPAASPSARRIAIKTGLTEREVTRLQSTPLVDPLHLESRVDRVGRVLTLWHEGMGYSAPYGVALELNSQKTPGSRGGSFEDLMEEAGVNDCTVAELLEELIHIGVVRELPNGRLRVVQRSYLPDASDPASLEFMTRAFTDLAETLEQNLTPVPHGDHIERPEKYFERRVWSPSGIPQRLVAEFQAMVQNLGQNMLESLDTWISSAESRAAADDPLCRVGCSMYYFHRRADSGEAQNV